MAEPRIDGPIPARAVELVDVRVKLVPDQIPVDAHDDVALQLGVIGRTEDVAVSSDGRRLAIAGFNSNVLAIADFELTSGESRRAVVTSIDFVRSPELARPHGIVFIDDETLLVANRESELLLVDLPTPQHGRSVGETRVLVDGESLVPVRTPGSVAIRPITAELVEVIVCNNYVHDVTRYVIDRANDWRVIDAERLLAASLEIPDGIAISSSGSWIAVSNHNHNNVHLYRYDERLGPDSQPDGILVGPNYPHGLSFAADDRCLLVADAGLPYVHAYEALDGDWSGRRAPTATTRVMDDDSFNRARYNPQEGGPKGLKVTADDVVVVTSERQPLGFFELRDILGHELPRWIGGGGRPALPAVPDPASQAVARLVRRIDTLEAELMSAHAARNQLEVDAAEQARHIAELWDRIDDTERLRSDAEDRTAAAERDAREVIASCEAEVAALERRAGADLALAVADVGDLHAMIADLRLQVDLLRTSRSWRMTAPVRMASGLASGLRHRSSR